MPLVKTVLTSALEKIFEESFKKAFESTFTSGVSENDSPETTKDKISKAFSKEAKTAATKLADEIDKYIKTATVIVPSPAGGAPLIGKLS